MVSHGLTFKWGACVLHFPTHNHKHVQAVLKFQSPYFDWATDPILQFFPTKTHLQDYTSQTPGNTPSVHTHGNFDPRAQSHRHTNSTSVCLSENLSYEFIIISVFSSSIFDYEFDYNLFWTKATLHLASTPFPDEAAALSLSSLSPSSTSGHIISSPQFLLCPTRFFWCAATPVKFVVPGVSLHLSHFTHIVSRHTCTCIILHMHITRYHISFQSHTDMFMKTTQEFRLATTHLQSSRS